MNRNRIERRYRKISLVGRKAIRGLTMVELLIGLTIGSILLVVAVPTYSTSVQKNRIGTTSGLLYTSLNLARSEAVKRRNQVRLCPSVDSVSCRNDGDWSNGWILYDDMNSNDAPDPDEIIRVVDSLENGIALEVSASIAGFLQFQPTGVTVGNGGNNGEFRICHQDSTVYSHVLSVSAAGQVRLQQRTSSDCSEAG